MVFGLFGFQSKTLAYVASRLNAGAAATRLHTEKTLESGRNVRLKNELVMCREFVLSESTGSAIPLRQTARGYGAVTAFGPGPGIYPFRGRAIQVLPDLLQMDACATTFSEIYKDWPPPNIEGILGPRP